MPITLRYKRREAHVEALIDTGADYTVIPKSIAKKLQLAPWGGFRCEMADGSVKRLPAATAVVRLNGREAPSTVLVAPKVEVLIGAETLEVLRIVVDPKRRRIRVARPFVIKLARSFRGAVRRSRSRERSGKARA